MPKFQKCNLPATALSARGAEKPSAIRESPTINTSGTFVGSGFASQCKYDSTWPAEDCGSRYLIYQLVRKIEASISTNTSRLRTVQVNAGLLKKMVESHFGSTAPLRSRLCKVKVLPSRDPASPLGVLARKGVGCATWASDLQNARHDHRAPPRLPMNVPLQILPDFFLDDASVHLFLGAGNFERPFDNLTGRSHKLRVALEAETAAHQFRPAFQLTGVFINRDDRQHNAVFRNQPAIAHHHVADDFAYRARIDADTAPRHAAGSARALEIEFQHVAGFENERFLQTHVAQVIREARVFRELSVLTVHRHEVFRPHQIQHQPQFFAGPMPRDMQRRIHAAIKHVGAPLAQMIDHPEDRLFVPGNYARTQHHHVARGDRDVLVVIHRDARERRHRFALRAGNQHRDLRRFGRHYVLRANQNVVGNL